MQSLPYTLKNRQSDKKDLFRNSKIESTQFPLKSAKSRSDETDEEESDDANLLEEIDEDFENDERFK
jgi:hypothetical protein